MASSRSFSLSALSAPDFMFAAGLASSEVPLEASKPKNMLIVIDGNWFYNAIVLGQNTYGIDPIRHVLGRDWEEMHRIDYRRLIDEIEAHMIRYQPSAKSFRSVAFFCSPPNVPLPESRVRMLEDMASCGIEVYHVPSNPVAMATEIVSSVSTYDIACVVTGDRSITYSMGHVREKGKLVGLVTLRGAFAESDYTNIDFPVFWLEDRVDVYVTPYPPYMRWKPTHSPLTLPGGSSSLIPALPSFEGSTVDRFGSKKPTQVATPSPIPCCAAGLHDAISPEDKADDDLSFDGSFAALPLDLSRDCSVESRELDESSTKITRPPRPYPNEDLQRNSLAGNVPEDSKQHEFIQSSGTSSDLIAHTEEVAAAFVVKCLLESPYPNVSAAHLLNNLCISLK